MFSAICYKQVKRLYLLMQKSKKILSFSFLITFGLFFVHSELNFLSEVTQGYPHNHHDYCEVVKEARIENPDYFQQKIIPKEILFNNDDCCIECKKIEDILHNDDFSSTKKFYNTYTFLINKTLLI
ncbi:MAG: hypothetical protein A2499_18485 [Stygiobacter sp. RIFOXYC12_FULL_38_8]|nr:MAG: hypothetical protein A2X62_03060 [Stygiobacter sp. GWC2_38_9]OGV05951.1 MAG: hypothetical protein A2299_13405 [Stygiobacter sp. RIFOXYB2_FULL_37_11]OGV09959.1 MAG: hypothetical protein A2237_06165 [Stygiobacter sp. RIFOXYA2_FULL_38_8]OGV24613.1 MAG: hypothetical protein A2499_18485 [Stygiobacter sp. RIFOXYC12_FULL_38_8]